MTDIRWLRCDIKSINLLGNVLAKEKAAVEQAYEAIQHREGIVTEGSSTNVFAIQDGVLHTHPATNLILNGITRQLVLTLCRSLQLPVQEEPFDTDFLLNADEVFITSTTNEVLPIVRIGDREVGPGVVGPLTAKLQEAFDREIEKTCAAAQSNS
jgi:D-alanine transaminase